MSTIPGPVISIDPASATVCTGALSTITSSVSYAGLNPTYHWTKNGSPVGSNSSYYTSAGFANNDLVACSVTSGGTPCETVSAQSSDAVTIKVINNTIDPQINIVADNTIICNCTTITFKATVLNGGASPVYQWKVNGIGTGNTTNMFISNTLKAGDVINCVYSDNTSCVANGSAFSNSIQISAGTSGTPSVHITSSQDTICTGSAVVFTASPVNAGTNPSYQWILNGINTGTNNPLFTNSSLIDGDVISCAITTDPLFNCANAGNASSNNVVMNVTNKGVPSVNITTISDTVCRGAVVTFSANAVNVGLNPTYQWKINGISAGTNNRSFTASSLTSGDVASCTVITDPVFTCALGNTAGSNNLVITVKDQQAPSANIKSSANDVCAGEMLTFNAVAQDAGLSPSFEWILNNTSLNIQTPVFSSDKLSNGDELYCLITPDKNACSTMPVSSNTIIAIIENAPEITISPADTVVNIGQQVPLKTLVSGNIASYTWFPSDRLEDPFTISPSTIHLTENTTFILKVISDKGCGASSSAIVKVVRPLLMPNVFSPNGDGLNDVYRIPPDVSLLLQEFSIFDRWGSKVFSTHNISEGWNGTFNGMPVIAGTYVYFIKGSNDRGTVFLKGTVVLIR